MPLNLVELSALPECHGKRWSIGDEDRLATLTAIVLRGLAQHAEMIIRGAQPRIAEIADALKQQLHKQLFTPAGPLTYQRDGLLFEIISWIAASLTAQRGEIVSMPHLKSTQQGLDTIKVSFDEGSRTISRAVVHEQKCTDNPRTQFRDHVIPAFKEWKAGTRDHELMQAVASLITRFDLTEDEYLKVYDKLVHKRPLAFQAALTVTPPPFEMAQCVELFEGFNAVTPDIVDRLGDTFPLGNVRAWFNSFAAKVWQIIEAGHV